MHPREPPDGVRSTPSAARRGRRRAPQPVHPDPRGFRTPAAQPALQLGLRIRARSGHRRSRDPRAQRARTGRVGPHQRHGVRARPGRRLRRVGRRRSDGLGARGRRTVLPAYRGLRAGRPGTGTRRAAARHPGPGALPRGRRVPARGRGGRRSPRGGLQPGAGGVRLLPGQPAAWSPVEPVRRVPGSRPRTVEPERDEPHPRPRSHIRRPPVHRCEGQARTVRASRSGPTRGDPDRRGDPLAPAPRALRDRARGRAELHRRAGAARARRASARTTPTTTPCA